MTMARLQQIKGLQKPQRQTFKQQQLERLKQRVQLRQAEEARVRTLKAEAVRLDSEIKRFNYLGSVSNFQNQYKTIPEEIRKYMTVNPNSAKSELNNRIKQIELLIQKAREKEIRYDKAGDRPKEDQYRAEQKGYREGLARLRAGELLKVSEIDRYADDLGDAARIRRKAKQEKKKAKKALLKVGEITSINYAKGFAVVNGQRVSVSKRDIKGLELTSVKRSRVKNIIEKAADPKKSLNVKDFEQAREFGISSSDLLKVTAEASKLLTKQRAVAQIKQTKAALQKVEAKPVPKVQLIKFKDIPKQQQNFLKVQLGPTVTQQINQRQTTTPEIQKVLKVAEAERKEWGGLSVELRGKEKVKRAFKGEIMIDTALGPVIRKPDGSFRSLTGAEQKEITPKVKTSVNPINVIFGFFGLSKDIANFITLPNKKQKIAKAAITVVTEPDKVIEDTIEAAVLNPFGFYGEVVAGGALARAGKTAFTKPLEKIKTVDLKQSSKVKNEIKKLKDKGVTIRDRTSAGQKLRTLQDELKIINSDILDLTKAINAAARTLKTKTDIRKQAVDIKAAANSFKKRGPKRKKIQTQKKGLPKVIFPKPVKVTIPKQINPLKTFIESNFKKLSQTDFKKLKNRIKKQQDVVFRLNKKGKVVEMKRKGVLLVTEKKINPKAPTKQFIRGFYTQKEVDAYFKEIRQGKKLTAITKKQINEMLDKPRGREVAKSRVKEFEKQRVDLIRINQQLVAAGKTIGKLPNEKAVRKRVGQEVSKNLQIIKTLERKILELKKSIKDYKPKEVAQDLFAQRKKIFQDKFKKEQLKVSSKITEKTNTIDIKLGEFEFIFKYKQPSVPLKGDKRGRLQRGAFSVQIKRTKKIPYKNFEKFKDNTSRDLKRATERNAILKRANQYYAKSEKIKYQNQRKLKSRAWDKQTKQKFKTIDKQIKTQQKALDNRMGKLFKFDLIKLLGTLKKTDVKTQLKLSTEIANISKNINKLEQKIDDIKPPKPPVKPPRKPKKPPGRPPKRPPKKPPIKPPKKPPIRPPKRPPKKPPGKPPKRPPRRPLRLPKFGDPLPRGTRLAVNIRIAGKVFAIKKPINEALRRATTIVLRDKKLKRFDLVVAGVTKQNDIKRPKALQKFKGTKGDRVYTYVQK